MQGSKLDTELENVEQIRVKYPADSTLLPFILTPSNATFSRQNTLPCRAMESPVDGRVQLSVCASDADSFFETSKMLEISSQVHVTVVLRQLSGAMFAVTEPVAINSPFAY